MRQEYRCVPSSLETKIRGMAFFFQLVIQIDSIAGILHRFFYLVKSMVTDAMHRSGVSGRTETKTWVYMRPGVYILYKKPRLADECIYS